jgi:hypothetical protein
MTGIKLIMRTAQHITVEVDMETDADLEKTKVIPKLNMLTRENKTQIQ